MRAILKSFATAAAIMLTCIASATELRFENSVSGAAISNSTSFSLTDPEWNISGFSPVSKSYNVVNYIELSIIEDMSYYYDEFDITVPLTVDFYTLNNNANALVQNTEEFDLTVTFDATGSTTHTDKHLFDYTDAYKIVVTVGNTGSSDISGSVDGVNIPTASLPQVLKLTASIDLDRYYKVPTAPTSSGYSFYIPKWHDQANNELNLTIQPEYWTEYYELEYTWVNSADGDGGSLNTNAIELDFKNNSTRLYLDVDRTASAVPIDITYMIPMVFQQGYVVWRARPVGVSYNDPTIKIFGGWSHGTLADNYLSSYPNGSRLIVQYDHEPDLNWVRTSTFSEEGKRKDHVMYSDGLLKLRQNVTRVSSEDNAIVDEMYYDHQGRLAVLALPVPSGGEALEYYANFNRPISATSRGYNRTDFDITSSCALTVDGMVDTYGASNYYSPQNPDQDEFQGLVPDANDFPFTQTEYTPDLSGRIRSQTGVGSDFKLGSGRETKYYYGTPAQPELDRVFGSEVGLAQRYKKTMYQDANGQLRISYFDPYGRTVATCLAGDSPTSLDTLDSNTGGATETVDLLETNSAIPYNVIDLETGAITMERSVLIDVATTYTFDYDMDAAVFDMLNDCPPADLCYECVYDLSISIIDECGTEMIPSGPHTQRIGSLDSICGSTVSHGPTPWAISLDIGSYNIIKTLTVAEDAINYYTDLYLEHDTCLLDLQHFIDAEMAATDFDVCDPPNGCENICLETYGARDDWSGGTAEYDSLYNACTVVCKYPDNCESYLAMMKIDVSPGGQYGATTTTPADDWAVSVYNTSNSIPGSNDNWKYPDGGSYLDANGNPSVVYLTQTGATYSPATAAIPTIDAYGNPTIELQDLTNLSDFLLQQWQPSYAEGLVKYHPEYCYVTFCEANRYADHYLYMLLDTKTWDEAVTAGYVSENTNYNTFRDALISADPYFTENATDGFNDYDGWGSAATGKYDQVADFKTALSSIDGSGIDFRALAIGHAYCEGLTSSSTPTSFATCVSNNLEFWNDDCNRDKVWNTLKMAYISARMPLVAEAQMLYAIDNGCYNGCIGETSGDFVAIMGEDEFGCVTATQTCGSGWDNNYNWAAYAVDQICGVFTYGYFDDKIKRVPDITDVQDWTGYTDLDDPTIGTVQSNVDDEITTQCEDACAQMATEWMDQLAACEDLPGVTAQDMIDLEAYLVWVCKQGCDADNPFGSTTAPGSSPYASFEDAIYAIIYDSTGTMDISCTDELITFPGPQGHNSFPGANYGGLDSCYCDLVLQAESAYADSVASQTFTDNGFPDFANNYLGVSVYGVENHVCDCNEAYEYGSGGPSWHIDSTWTTNATDSLAGYAALVPEGLLCPVCIDCDAVDDGIDSLEAKFSITFSWDTHGEMLADYLNDNHNMQLPFFNYYDFAQACDSLALPGDTSTCLALQEIAVDLEDLLNNYAVFPHDTVCLCGDPFSDIWTSQLAGALDADFDGDACSHSMYYDASESDNLNYVLEFSGLDSDCDLILTLPDGYDWNDIVDITGFSGITWIGQNGTSGDFTIGVSVVFWNGKFEQEMFITITGSIACLDVADCFDDTSDLLLCNQSIESLITDLDDDPCVTFLENVAISNATANYELYINEQIEAFQTEYISDCLAAADDETFTMSGTVNRYHYTLFYFDQAGNLDKTVPPAGVDFLTTQQEFDDAIDYRNDPENLAYSEVLPSHTMETINKYDARNNLVEQRTPDGGTTYFYYDRVGRLVASQNAKQAAYGTPAYNYNLYDAHGRQTEIGEIRTNTVLTPTDSEDAFLFLTWLNTGTKQQISYTYYDEAQTIGGNDINTYFGADGQENLRNRVATTVYKNTVAASDYVATHYSYDIHGNVKTVIQENTTLADLGHDLKRMDYEYDLISANVKKTIYQSGEPDQFIHRYTYDADNRLISSETSYDGIVYDTDVEYEFYQHGPIARQTIGDQKVQGLDAAYTINGWLKGVNGSSAHHDRDMGADGVQGTNKYGVADVHEDVARDAFGFTLHYYNGDYSQIHALTGGEVAFADDPIANNSLSSLYNGNIRTAITAMQNSSETAQEVHASIYEYDQLQRITSSNVLRATNGSSLVDWSGATDDNDYDTEYTYDANGNLLTLKRNGDLAGTAQQMDYFTYNYLTGTNQLDYVSDGASAASTDYATDIDNTQTTSNYDYDEIGQVVADDDEDIEAIAWTTYGKVASITRNSDASTNSSDLQFYYDPTGNRVMKIEKPRVAGVLQNEDQWTTTYYVRDASGDVVSTYELTYSDQGGGNYTAHYKPVEQSIYGMTRIGVRRAWSSLHDLETDAPFTASGFSGQKKFVYTSSPSPNTPTHPDEIKRELGHKQYEMGNQNEHVLVTTSDRKLPVQYLTSGTVDYFKADVLSYSDYYPFGMEMPNRNGGDEYRFGYQGSEKDTEAKGDGNSYSTYYRQLDPRLGRWLSLDPLASIQPSHSPYVSMNNNPIVYNDVKGDKVEGTPAGMAAYVAWKAAIKIQIARAKFEMLNVSQPFIGDKFDPTLVAGLQNYIQQLEDQKQAYQDMENSATVYVMRMPNGRVDEEIKVNQDLTISDSPRGELDRTVIEIKVRSSDPLGGMSRMVSIANDYEEGRWSFAHADDEQYSSMVGHLTDVVDYTKEMDWGSVWTYNYRSNNLALEIANTQQQNNVWIRTVGFRQLASKASTSVQKAETTPWSNVGNADLANWGNGPIPTTYGHEAVIYHSNYLNFTPPPNDDGSQDPTYEHRPSKRKKRKAKRRMRKYARKENVPFFE